MIVYAYIYISNYIYIHLYIDIYISKHIILIFILPGYDALYPSRTLGVIMRAGPEVLSAPPLRGFNGMVCPSRI